MPESRTTNQPNAAATAPAAIGAASSASGIGSGQRLGGQRRGIGAEAEPGRMAEAGHAARPHHHVQRGGEQHRDQTPRSAPRAGTGRQTTAQPPTGQQLQPASQRSAGAAGRISGVGLRLAHASAPARPSSPFGRKTSTAAITANTSTSVACGSSTTPNACSNADQQRREIGARQAAEAADHDDHESVGDRRTDPFAGSPMPSGSASAPPRPGQSGAEREHDSEKLALIDAQGGNHVAVCGGGAHQRAPARAVQQQPQRPEHHRPDARSATGRRAETAASASRRSRASTAAGTAADHRRPRSPARGPAPSARRRTSPAVAAVPARGRSAAAARSPAARRVPASRNGGRRPHRRGCQPGSRGKCGSARSRRRRRRACRGCRARN